MGLLILKLHLHILNLRLALKNTRLPHPKHVAASSFPGAGVLRGAQGKGDTHLPISLPPRHKTRPPHASIFMLLGHWLNLVL